MLRASRFLLAYARSTGRAEMAEVVMQTPRGPCPATLLLPATRRPAPAWIVLHGLTVYGRQHPSLLRFARALCVAGSVAIIPEIEEWTRLRIRTTAVIDAVAAAAEHLEQVPQAEPGRAGLVGFSFGATQGLVAACTEPAASRLRSVVGFGGYCELHRLADFMATGEHEWKGQRESMDPDPYARWIVAGNYLTLIPGMERFQKVAEGALRLAEEAGRGGLYKPDEYIEPFKADLRAGLSIEERSVWDLVAPPVGQLPADQQAAQELAAQLADAAIAIDPLVDPRPVLPNLRIPAVLAHGRADRLIPYTETLRLGEALPSRLNSSVTVTSLFAHSIGAGRLPAVQYASEAWRFLRFLNLALSG
jgi:dienelactone hydrolase